MEYKVHIEGRLIDLWKKFNIKKCFVCTLSGWKRG